MKNLHRREHTNICLIMLDYGNSFSSNESLSNWTDLGLMTFHFHGFTSRVSGILHYIPDGVCYLFNFLQFAQHKVAFDQKLHEGIQAKNLLSWIPKIALFFSQNAGRHITSNLLLQNLSEGSNSYYNENKKVFPNCVHSKCMYIYMIISIKVKEKKPHKV